MKPVIHHTGLEFSGGATRVARLLMDGLVAQGIESRLTFELSEKNDTSATLPEAFGGAIAEGELPHIHCTGNWPGLLSSIPEGCRVILTLHDCELFTGGCPYPLDCSAVDNACPDPCPRRFPESAALRKLKLQLLKRIDPVLVAPSRWLARLAKTHLFEQVAIIPNGIPWPARPPRTQEARRQLGINPAARVALFAAHGGAEAVYKSGQDWKRMWLEIKAQVPEALCFAVGGDTAGRDGDLVVWPYVDRERLALLMAAADVLLYPTQADNHSLVILEAMAQALPVVAYGVGGVPEQIADHETGLLVEPGQSAAFIQAAVKLLSNPGRSRDLGQAAFSNGQKRFTVDRMVGDYMKLYV